MPSIKKGPEKLIGVIVDQLLAIFPNSMEKQVLILANTFKVILAPRYTYFEFTFLNLQFKLSDA